MGCLAINIANKNWPLQTRCRALGFSLQWQAFSSSSSSSTEAKLGFTVVFPMLLLLQLLLLLFPSCSFFLILPLRSFSLRPDATPCCHLQLSKTRRVEVALESGYCRRTPKDVQLIYATITGRWRATIAILRLFFRPLRLEAFARQ